MAQPGAIYLGLYYLLSYKLELPLLGEPALMISPEALIYLRVEKYWQLS